VLAIGVPENDFSRSMGIAWLDDVGLQKARSVEPDITYLGPRYDVALLRYYLALWQTHPKEMLEVYYLKFSTSGTDMLMILRGSPGLVGWTLRALLTPLSYVPNGLWLLAFNFLIAAGSLNVFLRRGTASAFVMTLLSLAACLVQIESGLVYSLFTNQYHNYLAFYEVFLSLLGVQLLTNAAGVLLKINA
jgi:hypothetical protein